MPGCTVNDIKREIEQWLGEGLSVLAPECAGVPVAVERPKQSAHGDYASNIALQQAKRMRRNPREFAQALIATLAPSPWVDRAEIAGAGFINLFLTDAARQAAPQPQ